MLGFPLLSFEMFRGTKIVVVGLKVRFRDERKNIHIRDAVEL
jgi:hypothetical protein